MENTVHTKTKAKSPQTNGICERFHRTMLEEFYQVAFRKKLYSSLDELQADVDVWINFYNSQRPHSGRYCYGKTPFQTFEEARHLAAAKMLDRLQEQTPAVTGLTGSSPGGAPHAAGAVAG